MLAGVPCVVSELTGAKEAVARVGSDFVIPAEAKATADAITDYFKLPLEEKKNLSERSRIVDERIY